ncbi:MAG: MarR family transcriptional regulator, partial [Alphaproteobacteria bacterium]
MTVTANARVQGELTQESVRQRYLECLNLVERLHRQLLDVIKDELERVGQGDVNSVQALLLFNIGSQELTA